MRSSVTAGRNFLLGAAAAWLAGGPRKCDLLEVLEVLIDVALGVVRTNLSFVSVWRVEGRC
ncbi:hypothetical protein M405DRAFT_807824, partial [Rhizopogon salebrosus TDB-379]